MRWISREESDLGDYHCPCAAGNQLESRQALIEHLKSRGILAVFHYLPLHLSKMGREFGGRLGQCPVTERVGNCLLRLPFYNDLSESEQSQVVEAVQQFDGWKTAPRSTAKGGA